MDEEQECRADRPEQDVQHAGTKGKVDNLYIKTTPKVDFDRGWWSRQTSLTVHQDSKIGQELRIQNDQCSVLFIGRASLRYLLSNTVLPIP